MANIQIIDNLALVPLTQTEVVNLNLSSLGVITLTSGSGGSGDMAKSIFATLNASAGFVDKAITATQVPYSGLTALPGGTLLFLRGDGTFATPPGQVYNVVSVGLPGLVPSLPASSGFNFILLGDGSWQPIATSIFLPWTQITGKPPTFQAIPHEATHITAGQDLIPPATTTKPGLVPPVPSSALSSFFLRADNTWQVIPIVTGINAGLVPNFPGGTSSFFRADGAYAAPAYSLLTGIPATFAPSAHGTQHVLSGAYPADLIPNFSIGGSAPGLVPASTGGSVNFLRADGVWFAPTGSGSLATSSGAGLMNQLPLTAATTYYFGGDNNPHLISSLSISYSQITPGTVPIFAGSSAGLVPNSGGGIVNFLRADGVFSPPSGGSLVTNSTPGLVNPVPASSGALYYLNGLDAWTLISTLAISWTQITPATIPPAFTPIAHAPTHYLTAGSDAIGPATTAHGGLVPPLPGSNQNLNFLRGDSSFQVIPLATPSASGFIPALPNSQTQWLRGDGNFQPIPLATTLLPGLVAAWPNNTTTFLNGQGNYTSVDYTTAVSGKPSTFAPQSHGPQHVTGGNDIIPTFTSSAVGLVPIGGAAGTYLNSVGGWTTPTGSGNVLNTLQINTSGSIQGGGDLTTNRTHSLRGDVTTPGASNYYGTNAGATIGWFAGTTLPVSTGSTPGLVPGTGGGVTSVFLSGNSTFLTPPLFTATTPGYANLSGGGTVNFLRADGNWIQPPTPGLATLSLPGLVPAQNASPTLYYLRGDDSWQLISQIIIDWSKLSNIPVFSGTTVNGLVPGATAGNAATFLKGDGTFGIPALAAPGTAGYIFGLPSSNGTFFWARGDNHWSLLPSYVIISSPWNMPAVGGSVLGVLFVSTDTLITGMTILTGASGGTQCLMEVIVTDGTHCALINQGYPFNPSFGTSIPGGLANIVGPGVASSGSSGFVPTPSGVAAQFLNGQGSWSVPPGTSGITSVSTQFSITGDGSVGTPVQLVNDTASPGAFSYYSTNASGTLGWFPLSYTWETNSIFVMPVVGSIQTVTLVSNVGITVGSTVVIEDNNIPPHQGFLEVISVNVDGIHIVVNNRGYAFNSPSGLTFSSNAAVTLAGPGIASAGIPGFVPPSPINDTVSFLRADGQFQQPGNVSTGVAGYVPVAPGDITKFLNGNGLFSVPLITTLATTSTPGAVAGLTLTNQITEVLRGDNTWVSMSSLSAQIAYASLSGLPSIFDPITHHARHISTGSDPIDLFSTAATTSGLVVGSNGVGNTFFLRADGTWATTPSGPSLATAGTDGLLKGLIASPTLQYLRGDNNWFPISGLAITYSQLTGTVPFAALTHGATHLDNGTDTIAVVAGIRTGLVPVLPAAAPTTKFLRGDATWTVVPNFATNAVTPGLVVGSNSVGTSFFLRSDNSWNQIQGVSTNFAGLAPILPASNGTSNWLRGDGNWVNIPFYWTISTSFTQPSISSPIVVTFLTTVGMQVGMCIATVDGGTPPVTNYYTISAINVDGVHATLINLGATGNTGATFTVNAGQANLNGPPVMTATGAGITPIPTNNATQFLCANASWSTPPTTGVPLTRNVNTQYSITGGGQLNADLTLNLVSDTAAPGNSMLYGTSSGGSRGWYASSSFPLATTTTAGLLPTLPTISPTTVFLNGAGVFAAPSGLTPASGTAAGIVPQLPAVPPASPTMAQWLRADNSWQFLPDSNVTTASWVMPAVGSTVPAVQFNATTNWDVGMTLFFATGDFSTCCYMEVTSVNNGLAQLTLSNRGYTSNPVVSTTIPTCMVFVVAPGVANVNGGLGFSGLVPRPTNNLAHFLRGDATFQVVPTFNGSIAGMVPNISSNSTTTFLRGDGNFAIPPGTGVTTQTAGSTFTWPAFGVTSASIQVVSSTGMMVGCALYFAAFGTAEVTLVTDGTHCTIRNNGNAGNATAGTVGIGTSIFIGTAGSLATGTSSGMIPVLPADSTKVLLGNGVFGTLLYSSLGSLPSAPPLHAPTHVTTSGTPGSDVIGPATTTVTGLVPVIPSIVPTDKWLRGDNTWVQGPPLALTTVAFTWPALAGSVTITVDSSVNMRQNMALYAPGLGICEVTSVISGTSITIKNSSCTNNAGSTASQTPAFYTAGPGAATATTTGLIPVPPNTQNTFLRGDASFQVPSTVSTSNPGYVPTADTNAAHFLNAATGTWTTPPTATATTVGYVSPPNNTYQFLRGDATWTSGGYNTTFSSFTVPAINIAVNVTVASATDFIVGQTHVITDGTLFMIGRVTTISTLLITYTNQAGGGSVSGSMGAGRIYLASAIAAINNSSTQFLRGDATYATPPSATATVAGYVPTPPNNTYQYLRGDATFVTIPFTTVTTAGFTQVAIGANTASIAVESSAWMSVGMVLIVGTGSTWNYMSVVSKADTTHVVLTNIQGATVSGTIASGANIQETAIPIVSATNAGIVPIPPNNTFQFLNGQGAFVTPCITYARFKPYDNIPFGTTYPAFSTRGSYGLPVLDCADAVTTDCLFSDIMPQNANLGSGLTVLIKWTAHTATTNAVRWQVAFGRLNASIATATFDTAGLVTSTTSGTVDTIATATVSALTTINGITAGDLYVCKVSRLGADGADTMTDTAELCSVEVRSAGT